MNLPPEEKKKYLNFLELLRQTPRDWVVALSKTNGPIRRGITRTIKNASGHAHFYYEPQCPISSIGDKPLADFGSVAKYLGLDDETTRMIISAADWSTTPPHERNLVECRRDLLAACGLIESEITEEIIDEDAVLAL